jgi:hypothetical protein
MRFKDIMVTKVNDVGGNERATNARPGAVLWLWVPLAPSVNILEHISGTD